jgi:uncharacterized protein (DUF427 family)
MQRVTILPSSKHIRVEIDGVEVANTRASKRLYETGFPIQTYVPYTDVRLDLLTDAPQTSYCPYKVRRPGMAISMVLKTSRCAG